MLDPESRAIPPERRFDPRDYARTVFWGSPAVAAAIAFSALVFEEWLVGPGVATPVAGTMVVANLFLAVAGSAFGGLLVRGTLSERIGAAAVAFLVAPFAYFLSFVFLSVPVGFVLFVMAKLR